MLATTRRTLVTLAALLLSPALLAADDETGFKPIFDGKTLEGWDGNPKFWSVEDGTITGRTTKENPTKGNTFLIWRQAPVDDFVIRLSYKIVGGNSGIQYRSREVEPWVVSGYQGDIDSTDTYSGILYEERARGILATRGQKVTIGADGKKETEQVGDAKELQSHIKKEDWNEYEITAQGNHLTHKINGHVTAEVIDDQMDKRAASGILALTIARRSTDDRAVQERAAQAHAPGSGQEDRAGRRHAQPRTGGPRVQRRHEDSPEVSG